jgi:hypothetical protein
LASIPGCATSPLREATHAASAVIPAVDHFSQGRELPKEFAADIGEAAALIDAAIEAGMVKADEKVGGSRKLAGICRFGR